METAFGEFIIYLNGLEIEQRIDLLGTVFVVIGGIFALFVFWVTANRFLKQSRASHYSALDDMYAALLRIGIEKPYLRTPEEIRIITDYIANTRNLKREAKQAKPDHVSSEEAIGETVGVEEVDALKPAPAGPEATGSTTLDFEATDEKIRKEEREIRSRATEYGTYAFMIFNFLETIHDRCDDTAKWPRYRPDKTLRGTWEGILREEHRLHADWFRIETDEFCDDTPKFCIGFIDFILNNRIKRKSWKYRSLYYLFQRKERNDIKAIKWKNANNDPENEIYDPFKELKPLERLYQRAVARLPFFY